MRTAVMALGVLVAAFPAVAQTASPYVGEQRRTIKALSEEEVRDYLGGAGHGFGLAAELNHYPGPKHVLELADRLDLTPAQGERTRAVHARMLDDAKRLGAEIVSKEAQLDSLFAEGRVTPAQLAAATAEIGRLTGELRSAHLSAHLEMRRILTAAQIARYDTLRGYGGPSEHDPSKHHH